VDGGDQLSETIDYDTTKEAPIAIGAVDGGAPSQNQALEFGPRISSETYCAAPGAWRARELLHEEWKDT